MPRYFLFLSACLLLATGCGSEISPVSDPSVSIQSLPVIKRVSPTSGKVGDTITIFGFGFSSAAPSNIVTVGGKSATAESYALVDPPASGEIEKLTFKVPTGAATGAGKIFVTVFELTSNADVAFTVNP